MELAAITFDCSDAEKLASFWADALGRDVDDGATADYAVVAGTPAWAFVAVPEAKSVKNRVHPDLSVPDLAAAVDRLVGLGARKVADFDQSGERWTTLTDPEGNEFDVVAAT